MISRFLKKGKFLRRIDSFEKIILRISGMRVTVEYEILNGEAVRLSRYRIGYTDGEDVRELEKSVSCRKEVIFELLTSCGIVRWNGFHGKHPKNVQDGDMFRFFAVVNDGQIICAEGSANYPKGYGEFIHTLNQMLNGM